MRLPRGRSDIEAIAWPPLLVGEAAMLAALVAELESSQWQDAEALARGQGEQLVRLAMHHARHSASFRKRLQAAGIDAATLDSPARLAALPPLTRRQVQLAGRDFAARQVPKSHLPVGETKTSGSTGEPVTVRRTAISRLFWAACTIREHRWHGRDISARMTSIRPTNPPYVEMEDWGYPVATLYRTGTAQAMPSTVDIDQQVALIDRFRPESLLSFPTNLRALVARWAARPEGPPPGLRHLRTVGETVSPALREEVRRRFGLELEDNYSSQEIGVIALQCPAGGGLYHAMAESLVVEVVDEAGRACGAGEVGRILVTDLHNFASPMLRYEIGDWAEAGGPCACGRGLPTLARVLGRERNLLIKADGTRHWPLVGFHRFGEVAPVQQYQVVQHGIDDIELKVVTAEALDDAASAALGEIVRRALGTGGTVRVTSSRTPLPNSRGGKFEEFVCRIGVPAAPQGRT